MVWSYFRIQKNPSFPRAELMIKYKSEFMSSEEKEGRQKQITGRHRWKWPRAQGRWRQLRREKEFQGWKTRLSVKRGFIHRQTKDNLFEKITSILSFVKLQIPDAPRRLLSFTSSHSTDLRSRNILAKMCSIVLFQIYTISLYTPFPFFFVL